MKQGKEMQRRPRLAGERLTELLDVAAEVFIADGFQGASTNVIAQRAGASKASLYSRFPTKEDLFLAVLEHRMNQIFQDVASTVSHEMPLRDALFSFGTQLLQSLLSDAQIALIRLVNMETVRFPQLGQRFFELGPERGLKILSHYFKVQAGQGMLRNEDPQTMALYFVGSVAGAPLFFRLLGLPSLLKSAKQRSQHLATAIDVFILAYGVPMAPASPPEPAKRPRKRD